MPPSSPSLLASAQFYGPSSSSTSTSSTSMASPSKKRIIRRSMDGAMIASPGSSPSSTSSKSPRKPAPSSPSPRRSRSSPKSSPSSSSSSANTDPARFKLHFNNRVYRPFRATAPPSALARYTKASDYLGAPDELVDGQQSGADGDGGEGGIIRCTCGEEVDDGRVMVCCDECDEWQHAACVGYTEAQHGEEYLCDRCKPHTGRRSQRQKEKEKEEEEDLAMGKWERERTPPPASSLPLPSRDPDKDKDDEMPVDSSDSEDIGLEIEVPSLSPALHTSSLSSPHRTPTRQRTFPTSSSPASSRATYSASRALLAQTGHGGPAASSLMSTGHSVLRPTEAHPLLTPPKKRHSSSSSSSMLNPGLTASSSASASKEAGTAIDPLDVPLPEHYVALLNLHAALERALLLHLATEGSKACGAAVSSSSSPSASHPTSNAVSDTPGSTPFSGDTQILVELPSLVSLDRIKRTVERGAGRRFGPTELGQLVWLWEGGLDGPRASEASSSSSSFSSASPSSATADTSWMKKRGGLNLSVATTRELDKLTGRKVHTWGIGISLLIKENAPLPALELLDDSPSAFPSSDSPRRPGSQSASPSTTAKARAGGGKRTAMSLLPLWSGRAEYRKEELRRRLGKCVLKAHADFAASLPSNSTTSAARVGASDPDGRSPPLVLGWANAASPAKQRREAQKRKDTALLSSDDDDDERDPFVSPGSRLKQKTGCSPTKGARSRFAFKKGFILDALPPIPSATLPALGGASHSVSPSKLPAPVSSDNATSSKRAAENRDRDGYPAPAQGGVEGPTSPSPSKMMKRISVADADAETARTDYVDEARRSLLFNGLQESGSKPGNVAGSNTGGMVQAAPPVQRAMSLLERIKAKEEAAAAASGTGLGASTPGVPAPALSGKAAQKHVARATLELASQRAKRREGAAKARSGLL